MFTPALEVITGPMCAGKSDELIRRLTLYQIANLGVIVIKPERDTRVSGLNLDFKETPFETTMILMALASDVTVLKAVCDVCRSLEAVRSQRLVEDGDRIVVGTQQYSPRCLRCYQPPE